METLSFNIFKHYFQMEEKLCTQDFLHFFHNNKKEVTHDVDIIHNYSCKHYKKLLKYRIQDLLQISAMPFQVAISILFFALFDIYFTSQFPSTVSPN